MKKLYKSLSAIILTVFGINANAQVATNYTFTQSNGSYVAITGGSVVGTPTSDDDTFEALNIGFQFKFNGMCYSQFGFGSNGYFEFGAGTITDDYNMISAGTDDNVISVVNNDMQLGSNITGTTVIGSPIAQITTSIGISVGDTLVSGFGSVFPLGTTITAVSATSFTASANANAVISGGGIRFLNGEARYQTIGAAPNRTLVVQWKNVRNYGATDDNFNFQLRLEESTNKISIVYGSFYYGTLSSQTNTYETGLRGITTADFNSRTTASDWNTTTAAIANTDACAMNATLTPTSGLWFNWNTNVIVPAPTVSLSISGNILNCGVSTATNVITANGADTYVWNTGDLTSSINPTSTITTMYSAEGTNTVNNCTDSKTITIVVGPNPTVTAVSNNTLLCSGQSANLTASGATSYTWSTNSNAVSIAVSPTATANYTVTGTDASGCTNMTTVTQSVTICTSITNSTINQNELASVFPNPTNDYLNVSLNSFIANQTIELYNALGELVISEKLNSNFTHLNIENNSNGIYTLRITENGVVIFKTKIVKY